MINNINKNSYNRNLNGTSSTKSNDKINQIQDNLSVKINIDELPKEELTKLNKFQNSEIEMLFKKIQEQVKKAELIAIKIVKGEKLTTDEQRFISEKYPDMKQIADKSLKECNYLKEQLQNCKTDEERQKLISNAISDVDIMGKKGALSEVHVRIKMSAIEEVEKFFKKIQEQVKKAELITIKIVKGEKLTTDEQRFISEKYPDMKQIADKSLKECNYLKEQLQNCKTDEQRQKVISNVISDTDNMGKKGALSEVEVKIKKSAIEEVEKFFKKIQEQDKKSELIAIKIVKGEKLTANEQRFISEKYPDMKQIADNSLKECKDLKEQLQNCKTDEERQQILSNVISDIDNMAKKGILSEIQVRIKNLGIEELKKEYEKYNNKEKELKFNINPYVYLNSWISSDMLLCILIIVAIISIMYVF